MSEQPDRAELDRILSDEFNKFFSGAEQPDSGDFARHPERPEQTPPPSDGSVGGEAVGAFTEAATTAGEVTGATSELLGAAAELSGCGCVVALAALGVAATPGAAFAVEFFR